MHFSTNALSMAFLFWPDSSGLITTYHRSEKNMPVYAVLPQITFSFCAAERTCSSNKINKAIKFILGLPLKGFPKSHIRKTTTANPIEQKHTRHKFQEYVSIENNYDRNVHLSLWGNRNKREFWTLPSFVWRTKRELSQRNKLIFFFLTEFDAFQPCSSTFPSCPVDRSSLYIILKVNQQKWIAFIKI